MKRSGSWGGGGGRVQEALQPGADDIRPLGNDSVGVHDLVTLRDDLQSVQQRAIGGSPGLALVRIERG